jgi:tartrate dehydratase beta subunit/fumarate hydratase class I family protein
MDKFTDTMLQHTGILGMIGKAERGEATIQSIKKHQASYLIAVGQHLLESFMRCISSGDNRASQ